MSRANIEEQVLLEQIVPHNKFDIDDPILVNKFIEAFNIQIFKEENCKVPGWSILWRHGGGTICPLVSEELAKKTIALACYLDLCGVDVALTNRIAYAYVKNCTI